MTKCANPDAERLEITTTDDITGIFIGRLCDLLYVKYAVYTKSTVFQENPL